DPKARANWIEFERAKIPDKAHVTDEVDFHQIVGAMAQYPTLLRKLGLVIDLLVSKKAFAPAVSQQLWVEVHLPEPPVEAVVKRMPDASPRTRTLLNASHFQALPRTHPATQDYRIADGLLTLDTDRFALLQSDVDAAGHKILNFARTLGRLKNNEQNHDD